MPNESPEQNAHPPIRLPLPPGLAAAGRRFHVALAARRRYGFNDAAFGVHGRVIEVDFAEAERLAAAINAHRASGGQEGQQAGPVSAALLGGAALLHELMHAVIASRQDDFNSAVSGTSAALGPATARLSEQFAAVFPSPVPAVAAGSGEPGTPPAAPAGGGAGASTGLLQSAEELLLLSLASENRALAAIHELFDPAALPDRELYHGVTGELRRQLARVGPTGATSAQTGLAQDAEGSPDANLLELLLGPQKEHPDSLWGQLQAALRRWAPLLGGRFARLLERALKAIDLIGEEHKAALLGPGPIERPADGWAAGSAGPEAFTADREWMPRVVLVAKNAYVWLAQLARRYGRRIERLDELPDEALAELAAAGFNGLWLIGIWQRSSASRTIKRLRGQPEAEASAYAIYDYQIAGDLGGAAALEALRQRALAHGIRLASDMVPNHTGIDSRWVIEHPEWFVQLDHAPYVSYRFTGPDLSEDDRVELRIEDHYYDGSDAAVVFQRKDRQTGQTRFIYHGNDGTATPWNDTAQLDYLRPEVREAVIDAIISVARRFPIVRFDAAMTLAKQHVRGLWHPLPGSGGAVPSRARYGVSGSEFEAAMPREFWREVVERLAVEVPDTLLLAEAFWLMEGYFVRSLGMHRVYNSAFMHMLDQEDNAGYRRLMAEVLEFDPRILERFVNYMTNPDEDSAAERFGTGDKAFAVATLMATLPGMPMFGHGQVEGLREKYGMEFRAPRLHEEVDRSVQRRHLAEIAPLLGRRASFARAAAFRLFDVVTPSGETAASTYAFSNRAPTGAVLVLVNNSAGFVQGRCHTSTPFRVPGTDALEPRREQVGEAIGLDPAGPAWLLATQHPAGVEVAFEVANLISGGWPVELGPYQVKVFLDLRQAAQPGSGHLEQPQAQAPVPARRPSRRQRLRRRSALLCGRRRALPERGR